jgi:hypothetical protein
MAKVFKPLTFGLACALGVWFSVPALADALYVRGGVGFLADGDLTILDLTTDPIETLETVVIIDDATDVTVEKCRAAVTTTSVVDGSKGVVVIDLSGKPYLGAGFCSDDDGDSGDDVVYDSHQGTLSIPCVEVDGVYFSVEMDQRGSSMNWEVTFAEPSELCGG